MRRLHPLGLLLLAGIFWGSGAGNGFGADRAQLQTSSLEGLWSGRLRAPPDQPLIMVKIYRAADGQLTGSVTGLDSGNPVFAIDAVEQRGNRVRLVVGEAGADFQGELSADGSRLTGGWSQLAIVTPLELVRSPGNSSPSSPAVTPR